MALSTRRATGASLRPSFQIAGLFLQCDVEIARAVEILAELDRRLEFTRELRGDTVEQPRPGVDEGDTRRVLAPAATEDTVQQRSVLDDLSATGIEVSEDSSESLESLDFGSTDVGSGDTLATMLNGHGPTEEDDSAMLEPVTMSEVGTKLDLARAYMDMGDPEGARSILDEVVQEGSASQKQEAQRLIETLPG